MPRRRSKRNYYEHENRVKFIRFADETRVFLSQIFWCLTLIRRSVFTSSDDEPRSPSLRTTKGNCKTHRPLRSDSSTRTTRTVQHLKLKSQVQVQVQFYADPCNSAVSLLVAAVRSLQAGPVQAANTQVKTEHLSTSFEDSDPGIGNR